MRSFAACGDEYHSSERCLVALSPRISMTTLIAMLLLLVADEQNCDVVSASMYKRVKAHDTDVAMHFGYEHCFLLGCNERVRKYDK